MTTGKTIAWTRWTFVGKVMSLLFNMLSRLVITFLPRSKRLLISWLQSPSAVILELTTSHTMLPVLLVSHLQSPSSILHSELLSGAFLSAILSLFFILWPLYALFLKIYFLKNFACFCTWWKWQQNGCILLYLARFIERYAFIIVNSDFIRFIPCVYILFWFVGRMTGILNKQNSEHNLKCIIIIILSPVVPLIFNYGSNLLPPLYILRQVQQVCFDDPSMLVDMVNLFSVLCELQLLMVRSSIF